MRAYVRTVCTDVYILFGCILPFILQLLSRIVSTADALVVVVVAVIAFRISLLPPPR